MQAPSGELSVATTHLSFVPGWNSVQLRRALAAIPVPLVLMGDLNMSGNRPAALTGYRPLVRAASFPADEPTRQLDHVLARGPLPPVRVAGARQLPLSDHRALIVEL